MKKYVLFVLSAILFVAYPVSATQAAQSVYATTTYKTPVSVTQAWKQAFKEKVATKSLTNKNIYLTQYGKSTHISISITLLKGSKTIQIKTKRALKAGSRYTLIIKNIKSVKGKTLTKKSIKKVFTTKKKITITTKPAAVTPKSAMITSTSIKTTNNTVTGVISEQNNQVTVIYDFRKASNQEVIEDSSLVVPQTYTLTYTKVPPLVSSYMTGTHSEKVVKGENKLSISEKMKEKKINISMTRLLLGNFNVEGTLTDDAGKVTPITLTFMME